MDYFFKNIYCKGRVKGENIKRDQRFNFSCHFEPDWLGLGVGGQESSG